MPAYVRMRRPERRWMHLSADAMEAVWKLLARHYPVVVVGPELERQYRRSRRTLATTVSLVSERDVLDIAEALERSYDGELVLLTVGRLDVEKNPLLLADILALLRSGGRPWRLIVVGEGQLHVQLLDRLTEASVCSSTSICAAMSRSTMAFLDLYQDEPRVSCTCPGPRAFRRC